MKRKSGEIAVTPVEFDPSEFGDDLAIRISWHPANIGGTNFRSHKLVLTEPHRAEFRPTAGDLSFCLIFLVVGLGLILGFGAAFLSGNVAFSSGSPLLLLIPVAVGLLFALVGGWMLYNSTAPVVFDKRIGSFWKGRGTQVERLQRRDGEPHAAFDHIHALQIISEECGSNKSIYYSYELNLVLADGNRINVVDHGNLEKMREDAGFLSRFLNVPVWDANR